MADALADLSRQRGEVLDQIDALKLKHNELGLEMATIVDEAKNRPIAPKRRIKPKPRQPNHDAAAKKYADFVPHSLGCLCGCGEEVSPNADFAKGCHRALRSIAGAVGAGKLDSDKMSDRGHAFALKQGWLTTSEAAE